MDQYEIIAERFQGAIDNIAMSVDGLAPSLTRAGAVMCSALLSDNKLLCCGGGLGTALSQLFVAGLLSRLDRERPALPAFCLNTDSASLCAIADDGGTGDIFARQIMALGQPGDVLLMVSTGGNNPSLEDAVRAARDRSMQVVAVTNDADTSLPEILRAGDVLVQVEGSHRSRIIELQLMTLHTLCHLIEIGLFGSYNQE